MITDGDRQLARYVILGLEPDTSTVVPGRFWSDGRERLVTRNPGPRVPPLVVDDEPGVHRVSWEVTGSTAARPDPDPGTAPGSPESVSGPLVRTQEEIHRDRPPLPVPGAGTYARGRFHDAPGHTAASPGWFAGVRAFQLPSPRPAETTTTATPRGDA